ncbi:MAG: hypothetical protein WBB74_03365 [Gaiellaceae bacterium]
MPTSPETRAGPDDRIVTELSRWLARHASNEQLAGEIERIGTHGLTPAQAEAVEELLAELRAGRKRAELEVPVREALEALALGA